MSNKLDLNEDVVRPFLISLVISLVVGGLGALAFWFFLS